LEIEAKRIDEEIERLRRAGLCWLSFPDGLEAQFEQDSAKARSHRLWLDGLVAIVAFNVSLLTDYLFMRDGFLKRIVINLLIVTPLALVVNALMRLNPPKWMREGCVAAAVTVICFINLSVEGGATAATAMFGLLCFTVTVLFANAVMRLRLGYMLVATALMSANGVWFLWHAAGLQISEKLAGGSIAVIGIVMTLTAGYGQEKQERLGYLLQRRDKMQRDELAGMNEELHRLSNVDKLTGLPNRRRLEEHFELLWERAVEQEQPLSAVVVDVDYFKTLNDVYGHLYGDEVLQRIAELIEKALRGHDDFVGRFGGEEFVVLMPDAERESALVVAERIRSMVEMAGSPMAEPLVPGASMWATVSCGVSSCTPRREICREDLLTAADKALYSAKVNGRNRVEFVACERVQRVGADTRHLGAN
jgi:diguanylate cyclase (GGDEF)-like protein